MPTYIMKDIPSLFLPFGELHMSPGVGVDSSVVVNMVEFESENNFGIVTHLGVPFNDHWESNSDTWTVEVEIDVGNVAITCRVRCIRLSLSQPFGGIIQQGSFTPTQVMGTSRTFNPVAPIWTPGEEDCENYLGVDLSFQYDAAMNRSLTMGLGTTANEVITDVSENVGSCKHPPPSGSFAISGRSAPDTLMLS